MKHGHNERGGALLMVLMIAVVFTVLGVGLITMNTSASKQFDKKEEQVQARHQAEMGILHYKAEVSEMLVAHNETLKKIEVEETKADKLKDRLELENKKFCSNLASKETTSTLPDSHYTVNLKEKTGVISTGCSYDEVNKVIKLTVNSIGEAGLSGKAEVDTDLVIKIPELQFTVKGEGGAGTGSGTIPPTAGNPDNIRKSWPCTDNKCEGTYSEFTEVSEAVMKMGVLKFEDHLVVDNFKADGGNGAHLTIAKDFYVNSMISVQNHACIVVQGNFTVKNTIESKNKLYIFVYGNAYLPSTVNLTSSNNDIFVSGNVYVDGVLKVPKPLQNVPTELISNGCTLPGPSTNSSPLEVEVFKWDLAEEIKATYN